MNSNETIEEANAGATEEVAALGEDFAVDEQISGANLHRRNDDYRIAAGSRPARSVVLVAAASESKETCRSGTNALHY